MAEEYKNHVDTENENLSARYELISREYLTPYITGKEQEKLLIYTIFTGDLKNLTTLKYNGKQIINVEYTTPNGFQINQAFCRLTENQNSMEERLWIPFNGVGYRDEDFVVALKRDKDRNPSVLNLINWSKRKPVFYKCNYFDFNDAIGIDVRIPGSIWSVTNEEMKMNDIFTGTDDSIIRISYLLSSRDSIIPTFWNTENGKKLISNIDIEEIKYDCEINIDPSNFIEANEMEVNNFVANYVSFNNWGENFRSLNINDDFLQIREQQCKVYDLRHSYMPTAKGNQVMFDTYLHTNPIPLAGPESLETKTREIYDKYDSFDLKKYLSQAEIEEKNYYLPCDITHFTKSVYYKYDREEFIDVDNVKKLIGPSSKTNFGGINLYYQDPYIQFYNGLLGYKNFYNMSVLDSSFPEGKVKKKIGIKCRSDCININMNTKRVINIYKKNDVINSVNNLTLFHIPVSLTGEKIVIKKGEKLILPEGQKLQNVEIIDVNVLVPLYEDFIYDEGITNNNDFNISYVESEQNKGGNFISAPDGTIFYVKGATSELLTQISSSTLSRIVELECGFTYRGFRHIDELMCFMPYGNHGYKIWFYGQLDDNSFNKLELEKTLDELNMERFNNLNKISMSLFDMPYKECTDRFVFFKFYSYLPSILNRTWYETEEKCICLFPQTFQPYNNIDNCPVEKRRQLSDELQNKVEAEMTIIKSMINPEKEVIHKYFEVKNSNELNPEGTLHCLIKQRFINPLLLKPVNI